MRGRRQAAARDRRRGDGIDRRPAFSLAVRIPATHRTYERRMNFEDNVTEG
jgi:hypothetical protein